ncbi:1-(5-phosphoribosyl)-5-[(5-phosphoribosylamino)methylideneamino]imidazole-4-carboxamide isomerase [Alicyclobacillus sp.]|uniref:1-(5-phosphoribosyl)-5-[(5- phosphoribosylamino)methylideneamino]imidazole-4- carboxamide isomerase n=1 Tax=Alicyclobacillus sp. TaxID=61169 RepID=UPI0025BF472A|nr:1-(5-phosphoribosyl)-5-[(5-phosphoribosylamino)methylideneamino]imidazole-4-carboxamide isomerase [Alicyclobacillus sp.]
MFDLFPAIDILDGACVRLTRGDYEAKTEYSRDPAAMAVRWMDAGARWLHVVDLDGAKSGHPVNVDAVRAVVEAAASRGVRVQVGGGIRTEEAIEKWLAAGVARCVIGTAAMDRDFMAKAVARFGADALVAGLDGRGGKMAVRGWLDQTDVPLVAVARGLFEVGVRHALVTDVDRDGTLQGANLDLARAVQAEGLGAIASGGIRSLEDVLAARRAGLAGAIAGRSIYDGTLDLAAAFAALREEETAC